MKTGSWTAALVVATLLPGVANARWRSQASTAGHDTQDARRSSNFEQHVFPANRLTNRIGNQVRLLSRTKSDEVKVDYMNAAVIDAPVSADPLVPESGTNEQKRRLRRRRRQVRVPMEASMEEAAPNIDRERKKRILMLISDTGGGHRASAQAMESMLEQVAPGATDVRIVDVFTDYAPWPYSKFVAGYAGMAKNPWVWRLSWYGSATYPGMKLLDIVSNARCQSAFRRCIEDHDPDLVVSIHPLTQLIPLNVLEKKGGGTRKVPFATIVTDLGSAHPWWFHTKVDACFVPSDVVRKVAERRGLKEDQIRQYGLPVRPSFWQTPRPREQLVSGLGLEADRKTVLVVGGGDGVGSLGSIVEATASELGKACPGGAQVVAVCGKNAQLRSRLESMEFGNVNVQVYSAHLPGWHVRLCESSPSCTYLCHRFAGSSSK